MWKTIAWAIGGGLALWFVTVLFWHDAPARSYAEQTQVITQAQPHSDWSLFWWGYFWGGGFGGRDYVIYRDTTNYQYRQSPEYQESGTWGTSEAETDTRWSWGSDDSGSWGTDNTDSDSGSWGSSWSSDNDSGSWGSSWSSDSGSGSWGSSGGSSDSWSSSGDSGSWGD